MSEKIFITFHKDYWKYQSDIFTPIQVGKKISGIDLDMESDDSGDNISEKNPNFCELTSMYWVWKNRRSYQNIGFYHYRRYFDLREESLANPMEHTIYVEKQDNGKRFYFCDDDLVKKAVSKYPVIVSKKHPIDGQSIAVNYMCSHISEDWKILMNVLRTKYPEYTQLVTETFYKKATGLYYANMFIMTAELFDVYMRWLFDILDEVEKHVLISPYPYQKRVFGYMGERLLHFFLILLQKNYGILVKEAAIVNIEMKV